MEAYMFPNRKLLFYLNFVVSILVFLLLLSGKDNGEIITRCLEKERQALRMFKKGLKDEPGLLSSWESDDDCCKWDGVQCSNRTNHVIGLHLQDFGGKLTPSLLELEYLTDLDLSFFSASGIAIPKFIGSIKGLKFLNLSGGTFIGEIPVQLWNLSNLQSLDLSHLDSLSVKNLNGLSHLSSLRYLDLSGVNLSMAHDWTEAIDRLPSLIQLKLASCELQIIPLTKFAHSFNSSSSLSILDLSRNHLGIELSRFHWLLNHSTTLTRIDLSSNVLFGGISRNFEKMNSLEYLDISRNMLDGELSNSIGNISTLTFLDLSNNNINGTIPPSLLKLRKIKILRLGRNQLLGELPEFFQSSPLIELGLNYNKLSGIITKVHLHNLSKLSTLRLRGNSLIFQINSDWVPVFNLTLLELGNCKIGPHFPSWLKSQTYLEILELGGCGIDDALPNWFGDNFPYLYYLNLTSNKIHGDIPYWSSGFGSLDTIDLSSNKFQNQNTSICNLNTTYLDYLDISNNLFSGNIPNCLMQLRNLSYLNLGKNKFSGKLPSSIGLLTNIEYIYLRHNSLDGELPTSLQQCTFLRIIDFGHNKFRGSIPRWIGTNQQNLVMLGLRSNKFTGSIPSTLCQLGKLQILDLSNNKIYGKLPNCLGNLSSMVEKGGPSLSFQFRIQNNYVYEFEESASLIWKEVELEYHKHLDLLKIILLSENLLSGEIPIEITYLEGLIALNISGNNLNGSIPQDIGRLQLLEFLDLSRNNLSGVIPSSLSELHFIGLLNLSTNNLSGRIPLSTQLQSFNASSYSGNQGLCGLPLPKPCREDKKTSPARSNGHPYEVEEEDDLEMFKSPSFYTGIGIGFAVGLWATIGSLLFIRSWRVTYLRLVSNIQDSLYVTVVVKIAILKRLIKK